ncbi:MAG: PLP-dependent aminotransferase family protein [Xanthobacteraceae bacterium]
MGGHNDADHVPLDALVETANDVLRREGRTLATYGLNSGPLGYLRLREFLAQKLKRTAGIACHAGEILITSGSLQALDLVNGILLSRGDTVIVEQATYQGALTRLNRLGVNAIGIPIDGGGMRMDVLAAALEDLRGKGIRPKYIYTIPTVQNPTGTILNEARRRELLALAEKYGVPIFEDDCYADLIWSGERPPALHAMSKPQRHPYRARSRNRSRRLYRRRLGFASAHAGDQDRCRLRRARANGARRVLSEVFRYACAGTDTRHA